ncbi:hypothetical protein CYMTET_14420 [Cymbomonas tetramitiformis]|uniref:Uncharacterized protein n=1 Tax=Cymbomonas tetramitiformis TaxID=36881 RepID=A0AAE0LAD7_9CHLO|nr:hypothetical protein CYMTET_14420 [Cymbomonas tetramitiformis]
MQITQLRATLLYGTAYYFLKSTERVCKILLLIVFDDFVESSDLSDSPTNSSDSLTALTALSDSLTVLSASLTDLPIIITGTFVRRSIRIKRRQSSVRIYCSIRIKQRQSSARIFFIIINGR